jgi:2-polyprenyl-3-methyl-5-hydroxy-6-metoxy-1,4-benzoquinol methylase
MATKSFWEKYYQETPLEKIPWQKTQANYFTEVIELGKVNPCSALDLGCGTGAKSIYLAKRGFKVTGIDISKTTIKYAKENARKAKVKIEFMVADATDLSFLGDKKFDFVLDWANLHGIPKNKRKEYVSEIIDYTKKGGKFLLRCFSKRGIKKEFARRKMGTIYLFSEEDINKLFGKYFKILETNKSKPFVRKEKEPPAKWLDEYLMERF